MRARLDVDRLVLALDAARSQRGLSWRTVAGEVGLSPSTLSRLRKGRRPDADALVAILDWLNMSAASFTLHTVEKEPSHRGQAGR
jgi:transcriptional regulator with XRE-family HTH domain